jgi:hypothetical protein
VAPLLVIGFSGFAASTGKADFSHGPMLPGFRVRQAKRAGNLVFFLEMNTLMSEGLPLSLTGRVPVSNGETNTLLSEGFPSFAHRQRAGF